MTPERWDRIKEVFDAAVELEAPVRAAFLADACGEDNDLRAEVTELLGRHEAAGEFLEHPLVPMGRLPFASDRRHGIFSPDQVVGGRFRVVKRVGEGGMGEVYEAFDQELLDSVALKTIRRELAPDSRFVARFKREVQRARAISHPNVCRVYDLFRERTDAATDVWFLTMELLRGETLSERLRRAGAFAVRAAVPLMVQMCRALDAAHRSGVVHRDFKSGNVMLIADGESEGRVVVTDFGLARQISSTQETHLALDNLGGQLGTPSYMAPEQLRGRPWTPASDIFSLGVVLYEMTAGCRPFGGDSPFAIADAILNYEPAELTRTNPDVPVAFERLVYRMLAKRPEERPRSAQAVLSEIEALGRDHRSTGERTGAAVEGPWAAVVPRVPSIAVLPFANLSDDKDNEYFSDGLTQELTIALASIDGLKVASRTSAAALKVEGRDVREIAARLNVDHVLEGSVRKAGNRLRIATQLIAATDGCQLWAQQYERDLAEVFAVQDEIAYTIVDTLKGTLMGRAAPPFIKRYTEDVEAYNLYLKGRYYWNHRYEGVLQKALDQFKQALDRAPQYALAYAGVADCFNILAFYNYLAPREGFRKAEVAAEKALAIDDGLAEAHASLGLVRTFFDWNFDAGDREFQRAIQLNPSYGTAHFWYGAHEMVLGRSQSSLGLLKRAWEADPLSATLSGGSAFMSYLARRYDEALAAARRTLELDALYAPAHAFLGWTYTETGRYDEAIASWQLAIRLLGGLPTATAALARTFALAGRRDEALRLLGDLGVVASQRYVSPYHVGAVHAALGQHSEAIAWLERAHEDRNNWLTFVRVDPSMDPLRNDSRFQALDARVFEGSPAPR